MIETLASTQHVSETKNNIHTLKNRTENTTKEEIRFLFCGPSETKNLSETVWNQFSSAFFSEPQQSEDPYERFEHALKKINTTITNDNLLPDQRLLAQTSIILSVFAEGTLHISVAGGAEVYLIRNRKTTIISDGLSATKVKEDLFANIASGELSPNDTLILSSERLLRYATTAQLGDIADQDIHQSREGIREIIRMSGQEISFYILHAESKNTPLPFHEAQSNHPASATDSLTALTRYFSADAIRHFCTRTFKKIQSGEQKTFLALALGILAVIVIIILTTSFSEKSNDDEYNTYKTLLTQTQTSLREIDRLESLGQMNEAQANLSKAKRDLSQILNSQYFRPEATALSKELSDIADRITGITRISNPRILVNLKTEKNDVSAQGAIVYLNDSQEREWYIYGEKTLFHTVLEQVEQRIELIDTASMNRAVPLQNKQKIIFMDSEQKIFQYDVPSQNTSLAKTEDETWKTGADIASFADNIYLLSPQEGQIWKYTYKTENFGTAIPYLIETPDLSDALSLTIDGYIFVLKDSGEVQKFYKGKQEQYEIRGAPEGALEGATQIYTNQELKHILFLNPTDRAVYIFHKGESVAEYINQIVFEGIGEPRRMWAQSPRTLVITDETKAYIQDF